MPMARRATLFVFLLVLPVLAFAQSADQEVVSVVDSPDPVTPGATLTYTVTLTNHGPDPAVNGGLNMNFPGELTYLNTIAPAGFSCSQFGAAVTCSTPSFAVGTVVFTVTAQVAPHLVNFPDGSFSMTFFPSGTTIDPNNGNNSKSATTSYDSPQIDVAITVSDAPDPVAPNQNVTYTVNVTNNGPNTGTNAIFNMPSNGGSFTFQSMVTPAGWSCTGVPPAGGIANFSCTKPSLASGATDTFTIVVKAEQANIGINDTTINQNFNASATGDDTNDPNNSETESTQYVAPDADLSTTVTDSPDPVTPDNNITYTVTINNAGPDPATSVNFNVFNNGSLRFQSVSIPAGWSCPSPPAVGGNPVFTCSNPSFAVGATSVFTVVLSATDEIIGINDTTVSTFFGVAANNTADPNNGNNGETETTAYITPDADMNVTVTDAPDPVTPDNNITYTVTINNAGPDAAPNATLNVFNNGSLRFQSVSIPAGWSCPSPPAVGGNPVFTCTNASFAAGATSVFTVVLSATDEIIGINDTTVSTNFSVSSGAADPNNANNSETESTSYVTPDANVNITASDSPDPVVSGANVTYTIAATNGGPDPATSAQVNFSPHPSLTFQSLSSPAGWSCTAPAIGSSGVVTCTKASMANGETANFTLVTKLVAAGASGTVNSTFTVGSAVQDPVPANNSVEVFTNWIGATADLSIGKSTLSTAAAQGGTIAYTISTANNGPNDATNVTITDVLHPALRYQSIAAPAGWSCVAPAIGTNGTVTCSIATFANGATANFTLVATVAPNATGSITNTALISSATSDPTPGNSNGAAAAVLIAGNADFIVSNNANVSTAARGGMIQFTIALTNAGPDPAASATLTDVLPPSLLFHSITPGSGWTCNTPAIGATGTISCTNPSQPIGAPSTFALAVTVANDAVGPLSNTVTASHSGPDATPSNNSAVAGPIAITAVTDLAVSKTTNATYIAPGQTFSYTIAVTNSGPDTATSVTMTDTLPASLLFQSINAPAGFTCTTPAAGATGAITCTAATLANGATATFTLTVQAAETATGYITNTATVSAAEDAAGGNNSSSAPSVEIGSAQEEAIPTLSEWALLGLMAMLGIVAMIRMRT